MISLVYKKNKEVKFMATNKGKEKKSTTKKVSNSSIKRKKNVKKKIDMEKYNNDIFMFSILLSVVCILAVSLKSYQFILFGNHLPFSLLIVPFTIFISNYITKKYGFKNSLFSIGVSTLVIVAFILLIDNLTNRQASITEISGFVVTYFGSMFINLLIYYYIILNMTSKSIMIGLNYLFTLVLNSFLYLLFFHELVLSSSLLRELTISFIIQFIISIGLIYCDRKIERGVNI